jgi:hypothetical protein
LTIFKKYRHDPLFQTFYLLRTDNYGQIAAIKDAILRKCANDDIKAIVNQKAESFNRLQTAIHQATATTPLLLRQTDPNYTLIPGDVPEDANHAQQFAAGYFQLAADAPRQSTDDKDKCITPNLAAQMQLAADAHQEPRMFDPQFQSDSR